MISSIGVRQRRIASDGTTSVDLCIAAAKQLIEELDVNKGDVTKDELFTVRDVRCIGACGLAPILTVGEKVYGKVKEDMVDGILNHYKEEL